jgi:outer membrane protein OmpA-like peptidoglycan-associated protein
VKALLAALLSLCLFISVSPAAESRPVTKPGLSSSDQEIIDKDFIAEQLANPGGDRAGTVTFSSDGIPFGYGSARLLDSAIPQLQEIAKALNDPRVAEIPFFFVDGHTCSIGTDERNCKLSNDRAASVVKFLIEKGGVPPEKLKARGFGKNDPVASNDTEPERKKNRRVVLKSGLLALQRDEEKLCNTNSH